MANIDKLISRLWFCSKAFGTHQNLFADAPAVMAL